MRARRPEDTLEKLEKDARILFRSRRWILSRICAEAFRILRRRPSSPTIEDSINATFEEFREWKKLDTPARPSPEKQKVKETRKNFDKLGPQDPGGVRKVQVGCGPHNLLDDWWNVDIRWFPGIDEELDTTQPWPFDNLEYVFGEHFLEHLTLDGAIDFMTHAGNSMISGGVMRLSTPNLTWVMQTHYPEDPETADPDTMRAANFTVNRAFHGWGHQFLYTTEMLKYLLTELGFEDVRFCSYGASTVPALMELEKHGGYSLHRSSPSVVIVEATKGHRSIIASEELNSCLTHEYLRYVSPKAH